MIRIYLGVTSLYFHYVENIVFYITPDIVCISVFPSGTQVSSVAINISFCRYFQSTHFLPLKSTLFATDDIVFKMPNAYIIHYAYISIL